MDFVHFFILMILIPLPFYVLNQRKVSRQRHEEVMKILKMILEQKQ